MAYLGDIKNNSLNLQAIPSISLTTGTTNSTGVDLQNSEGPATLLINVGAIVGTYTTLQTTLQECDTVGGTYVAMTEVPASIAVMTQNTTYAVTFWKRAKRFVRAVTVATGGTSVVIGAVIIAHKKEMSSDGGTQL